MRATLFGLLRYAITIGLLAAIYVALAKGGLVFAIPPGSATAVWPAAGVAVVALLLLGFRAWPGVWLGSAVANLMTPVTYATALTMATGNALEAILAAWLIGRYLNVAEAFGKVRDSFVLAAVAAGSCLIAAGTGATALYLNEFVRGADFWLNLWTWWLGDAASLMIVLPLAVACQQRRWRPLNGGWWWEIGLLVVCVAVMAQCIFGGWLPSRYAENLIYVTMILLIWVAFRFELLEVTATTLLLTAAAVWGTSRGIGAYPALHDSLFDLQLFMNVYALTGLALAGVVAQRRAATVAALNARDDLRRETVERKRVEERFRQLLDSSPDATLVTREDGAIVLVNKSVERLFGYPAGELIGQNIEILVPERHRERHAEHRVRYRASPHLRLMGSGVELSARRKNGHVFPVEIALGPVQADEDYFVFCSVRDITERKLGERALRESQERFDLAVRGSSAGIWDWDLRNNMVFFSPLWKSMLGYSEREIRDDFAEWEARLHPDDRERALATVREYLSGQQNEYELEHRLRHKDGTYRWILARGAAVRDAAGKVYRMVGSHLDITDQKRLQRRFELAVQASPVALLMIDATGRIVLANRQAEALFDYGSDALAGQPVNCLIPEQVREGHAALCAGFLAKPQMRPMGANRDLYAQRRDGSQVPIEVGLSPVETDDGLVVLCGIVDITDRKRALAAIEEAREAAESANRAKSAFLANMSHEIRTPMNAILGMSRLLLDTDLTPMQREHLSTVVESGEALLTIIDDILDLSKIEADKVRFERVPFSLEDCLFDALRSLAVKAQEKGLELIGDIGPAAPLVVGDPVRLRQILTNLIGNAVKFTGAGEVIVTVTTAELSDGQAAVKFVVADTGIGIPEDRLSHIFDPFEQVDASATRRFGGTGLGLAIVARLVELMGGHVQVQSVVGQGSQFCVILPFAVTSERIGPVPGRTSKHFLGIRVLVVDDHPACGAVLERSLRHWGMMPTLVASGAQALAELQQARRDQRAFDVLLVDWEMPGMSGLEFAQAACRDEDLAHRLVFMLAPQKKTVDLSGYDRLQTAACLFKPVKPSGLLDALCAVLQGPAASAAAVTPPRLEPGPPLTGLRILLAEDSLVNQKLTMALLRKRGHEVVVANDGREAVQAAQEQPFDLILMDIQMPEMDGYEATAAIRAREQPLGRHTPIIALTAHAMKGDRERCLQAGMDEYVTKPVRAEQLFDTMALVLRRQGARSLTGDQAGTPTTALIDWQRARSALDDDPQRLRTFLDAVIEILPGLLKSVEQAIQAGNGAGLQFAARTLMDTIRYLGADDAMHRAMELEGMGRDDRLEEAVKVFPAFLLTIERILKACSDYDGERSSVDLT